MKSLKALEPMSLLALRLALSLTFLFHGYPKLAHPTEAMRNFFISHGLPGYFLPLSGTLECFGALLLFLGLFTRPVGVLLAIEMCVAIWKVHSVQGIMAVNQYEFPMSVGAGCLVLATIGAGLLSMDHLIFGEDGKKRRSSRPSKD